jgi:hypothetical protein
MIQSYTIYLLFNFINIQILFFKDEKIKLKYKHKVVLDSMYIKSLNLHIIISLPASRLYLNEATSQLGVFMKFGSYVI